MLFTLINFRISFRYLQSDLEKYIIFIPGKFYSTFTTAYAVIVESRITTRPSSLCLCFCMIHIQTKVAQ